MLNTQRPQPLLAGAFIGVGSWMALIWIVDWRWKRSIYFTASEPSPDERLGPILDPGPCSSDRVLPICRKKRPRSIPISPPNPTLPRFLSRHSSLLRGSPPHRISRAAATLPRFLRPEFNPMPTAPFLGPIRKIAVPLARHGRRRPERTSPGNSGQPGSEQSALRLHPMWSGGCGCRTLLFGSGGPDAMVTREDEVELDYGQLEWPPVVPWFRAFLGCSAQRSVWFVDFKLRQYFISISWFTNHHPSASRLARDGAQAPFLPDDKMQTFICKVSQVDTFDYSWRPCVCAWDDEVIKIGRT